MLIGDSLLMIDASCGGVADADIHYVPTSMVGSPLPPENWQDVVLCRLGNCTFGPSLLHLKPLVSHTS